MRSLTLLILPTLLSCTPIEQKSIPPQITGPYDIMDNEFVTDLTLRTETKHSDLKSLLITLPVFEIAPTERKSFVDRFGVIQNNKLFVRGDGAQSSLTLIELDKPKNYELIIHGIEDNTNWHYIMKRDDEVGYGYDGWSIISRHTNIDLRSQ